MESATNNKLDLTVFKEMGDQYDDGVFFVYDLSAGQFIYLSPAFEPIWKRKVEEVKANPAILAETIHPEDRQYVTEVYEEMLEAREKRRLQFRILWPYTTDKWIRLRVFTLKHANQADWIAGIAENDSSRMKNIFNMQKINARKDSMLEILAHDLRGPIGIVQNIAALIEEELPKSQQDQSREHLRMIQKICQRNIDLIRDLVHQEFLESAEVEVSKERLDLVWEINEVIANYRKAQENLSKVFELTSSQEQIFSQVDSMKFMQVINNLVSNALKFTRDDGHIRIHVEKKKEAILIKVSDDGIGIPEKHHPFLFDKFTKARRPGLNGEESVGLGMSVIKTIVEMHDGKIWFESEEGKGTTFYIELSTEE